MSKKSLIFVSIAYFFFSLLCAYYLYEHLMSLIVVFIYEVGDRFVYLYHGYENLFIFRLIKNVMPLGTSVEVGLDTVVKGFVYICQSLGVVEIIFLLSILLLVFYNYYIEENQKDIVYIYNVLMTLFSTFLIEIIIYIILFLLSMIFLKILYETAFLIVTIILIISILVHISILIFTTYKYCKTLKIR